MVGPTLVPVAEVSAVEATTMVIEFETPPAADSGPVNVAVRNTREPDYGAAEFTFEYHTNPPVAVSVEPSGGPAAGYPCAQPNQGPDTNSATDPEPEPNPEPEPELNSEPYSSSNPKVATRLC